MCIFQTTRIPNDSQLKRLNLHTAYYNLTIICYSIITNSYTVNHS